MPRRTGRNGIVITDHEASSQAGLRILKMGGNAADAAVASAAALTVIDPYMAGLAGYGYLLYYSSSEDKTYALDFIGTAPSSASIDMFTKEKPWEDYKPTAEGPLAILVPGSVAGWSALLERFGTMKLRQILQPAIELARAFRVTEQISTFYESIKPAAGRFESTARIFYRRGSFPKKGHVLVQRDLARTLSSLAKNGAGDFYNGEIAKRMVENVSDCGGILSEEDLASYSPKWRDPVGGTFKGTRIYTQPPGSSGITMLQWLNILEGFEFDSSYSDTKNIHIFLEAGKLAMRDDDRWNTGKDYATIPVESLTSKEYAEKQRSQINQNKAKYYDLVNPARPLGESTTHFCVADSKKNIVSITQTQMYGFDRVGIYGDLGFNMNGGMCYFSLDPDNIEKMEPRQRPRYVMSPTIAFTEESRVIALGSAGGWTIPQTVTEVLFKTLQFGLPIDEAVSTPRFLLRYRLNSIPYAPGTVVDLEQEISRRNSAQLREMGHKVHEPTRVEKSRSPNGFGALNALSIEDGIFSGGPETRRKGSAMAL